MYKVFKISHKELLIRVIIPILFIITSQSVFGQIFDDSQNPPSVKWRQINTQNFQVIYPSDLETEGQRMANTLTSIINRVSFSYQKKPRKISIILQNQGTTANGFVQLAPRRSEFFTTPSQEYDYQDWLNSLAVHELRHVVQFDKLTGNLRRPFFETLALSIFGITLPPWFYEGDAVGIETSLTDAGRGRQPEFELVLRTNTLSGKKYSYSKDYLGSARDLPPGYYQLGYYMTSKLRRDHGTFIMDSIMSRIAQNPLRPYSLSSSIKKFTGLNTRQLHHATIGELETRWKKQLAESGAKTYPVINKRKNTVPLHYYMPVAVGPGKIAALKQGKGQVSALVLLDEQGKETFLTAIGSQEDFYLRYAGGKLIWDEYRSDARFNKRSFNVIMTYDLNSGKTRQVTHKSRFFAPNLSPDGKRIVAIEVSYSNHISLVELNENGTEQKRYASPGNEMLQTPSFHSSGSKVVVAGVSARGKTLYELNLNTGEYKQVLPYQLNLLSKPVYENDAIIFKSDYTGIDNLYRLNPGSKEPIQLTSVQFGAYNPSWDEYSKRIVFNNYQVCGNDIAYTPATGNQVSGKPMQQASISSYIEPLVRQEGGSNVFDSIPTLPYPSKPYRELGHLLNFHSLLPIVEANDQFNDMNYGLKLQSDNKLNTMSLYTGYQYNNALGRSEYLAGFNYSKFFPILNVSYHNQAQYFYYRPLPIPSPGDKAVSWRQHVWEAKVTIPLSFNRLNQSYYLGLESGTSYTSRYNFVNRIDNLVSKLHFPMFYRVYAGRNTLASARDLAPRWGQNIALLYRHFPFENRLSGELVTVKSTFYFPGLLRHHSLQASLNFQKSSGNYSFTEDIPRANGYPQLLSNGKLRNTLLTDYRFPLVYPDWEIGPLAYIKRFTGGLFADFENIGNGNAFSPRSVGAELKADMNLLRFYLPDFQLGGRIVLPVKQPGRKAIFEGVLVYGY